MRSQRMIKVALIALVVLILGFQDRAVAREANPNMADHPEPAYLAGYIGELAAATTHADRLIEAPAGAGVSRRGGHHGVELTGVAGAEVGGVRRLEMTREPAVISIIVALVAGLALLHRRLMGP